MNGGTATRRTKARFGNRVRRTRDEGGTVWRSRNCPALPGPVEFRIIRLRITSYFPTSTSKLNVSAELPRRKAVRDGFRGPASSCLTSPKAQPRCTPRIVSYDIDGNTRADSRSPSLIRSRAALAAVSIDNRQPAVAKVARSRKLGDP